VLLVLALLLGVLLPTTASGGARASIGRGGPIVRQPKLASVVATDLAGLRGGYLWDLAWVSDRLGWALVGVPCGQALCPRIARTRDGGRSWVELPTPPAGLLGGGCARLPCVEHLRFATATVGYLFGPSLLVTRDGGRTWSRLAGPPVESLEPGSGTVVRIVYDHEGCPGPCRRSVEVASVGSARWRVLLANMPVLTGSRAVTARVIRAGPHALYIPIYGDLAAGAGTQQTTIYRSLDSGRTWSHLPDPCGGSGVHVRDAIDLAATSDGLLAALCSPRDPQLISGYSVTTSGDAGRTWSSRRPVPASAQFYPAGIGAAGHGKLVITNSTVGGNGSYTYRLLFSSDDGTHWATVVSDREQAPSTAPDSTYLSFQNARVGHWVGFPHAIWTTTDGGRHWTRQVFPQTR